MDPSTLRYAKSDEWAHLAGDTCTVGITKYAVEQLTDITYLKLPKVGTQVEGGAPFGEVESVKSVNPLNAPVSGTVTAVNQKAADDTAIVTNDPFGDGWLVKIQVAAGTSLDHLLTLAQYEEKIANDHH